MQAIDDATGGDDGQINELVAASTCLHLHPLHHSQDVSCGRGVSSIFLLICMIWVGLDLLSFKFAHHTSFPFEFWTRLGRTQLFHRVIHFSKFPNLFFLILDQILKC